MNLSWVPSTYPCLLCGHPFMVVVGKHFTFLLIVVEWLKSNHLTAKTNQFLLPFQRQPSILVLPFGYLYGYGSK